MWHPTVNLDENRRAIILRAAKEDGADMTRLDVLKKSLLDMTPEELRDKVREIRSDRKLRKEAPKARKERVHTASDARSGLKKMLAGLSPEDAEALLQELANE